MDIKLIAAEVARLATNELWPQFDPRLVPLVAFDSERTQLYGYPGMPNGFSSPSAGEALSYRGLHPAVRANTSGEIDDIAVATIMLAKGDPRTLTEIAALAIHEAFHVFQEQRLPGWQANEVDLFSFPADSVSLLALTRLESAAFGRALRGGDFAAQWARAAIDLRRKRYADLPDEAIAYERGIELVEGLARYVELRALGRKPSGRELESVVAGDNRLRCYATGAAMAFLLDDLAPGWNHAANAPSLNALDETLELVLLPRGGAAITPSTEEFSSAFNQAATDIVLLDESRRLTRQAFIHQRGWQIEIIAPAILPLRTQGFDPMNIQMLGEGEMIHGRFLELGNGEAHLEFLDRPVLTIGIGPHPLFDGVRSAFVSGLPDAPSSRTIDGALVVEAVGFRGKFESVNVVRTGTKVRIEIVHSHVEAVPRK